MPHIVKSTILDAPTGVVWNVLRDFNGHDRWHPAIATSTIERAQAADRIGCVRRFKLKDGSELREQLLALSDLEQTFSYCLLDTPIPMFNYVAHVRLLPVTDGDRRSTRPASRRFAGICGRSYESGGDIMPVTVKTFTTSGEAAAALSSEREARYLGGGTLVMRALNEGDISISTVVRATDRALTHLDVASSRITIGAGVTFARVLAERELAFLHPVAGSIGGPAVRNMGTIGGNLFAPTPFGDFAVALLALDATVSVQGGYGARDAPIEEFLAGRDRFPRALVLSVSCQRPSNADAFRYRKLSRIKPKGGSVVTLAAHLPTSGGRVIGARIALGAMAAAPVRAKAAERALEGRVLDAASVSAAVAAATEGTSPVNDSLASAWYRREVVGVHLRRLLTGQV